jgi:hypothetical protein
VSKRRLVALRWRSQVMTFVGSPARNEVSAETSPSIRRTSATNERETTASFYSPPLIHRAEVNDLFTPAWARHSEPTHPEEGEP